MERSSSRLPGQAYGLTNYRQQYRSIRKPAAFRHHQQNLVTVFQLPGFGQLIQGGKYGSRSDIPDLGEVGEPFMSAQVNSPGLVSISSVSLP
ncbi:hypothetical protein [Gaoshiqia sp. Z1-71]|uniref:hypothetical protein n=1 Tax=Gaoshiqia hydrogeniformans TaxID=3290090 RepID=UPI003BF7C2F6